MTNKNERPILFSTPMVQAIFEDRKTQTRRVVKLPKGVDAERWRKDLIMTDSPYKLGMVLWVRETFAIRESKIHGSIKYAYRADGFLVDDITPHESNRVIVSGWKPSIFMPREACRLYLGVVDVRCERLHEITEDDAEAEGFDSRAHFEGLWEHLNAKRGYGWDVNPFVWVVDFKRTKREGK